MQFSGKVVFLKLLALCVVLFFVAIISGLLGRTSIMATFMYALLPVFIVTWIIGVKFVFTENKKVYQNIMRKKPLPKDSTFRTKENGTERSSAHPTD